jgi:hypothetical protein
MTSKTASWDGFGFAFPTFSFLYYQLRFPDYIEEMKFAMEHRIQFPTCSISLPEQYGISYVSIGISFVVLTMRTFLSALQVANWRKATGLSLWRVQLVTEMEVAKHVPSLKRRRKREFVFASLILDRLSTSISPEHNVGILSVLCRSLVLCGRGTKCKLER